MNKTLEKLIQSGIPVQRAVFHSAVNNADNVPENYFALDSNNASRRVSMWYTQAGLICHQKTVKLHEDKYWIVPLPTVIFANLKNSVETEISDELVQALVVPAEQIVEPKKTRRVKPKVEIE